MAVNLSASRLTEEVAEVSSSMASQLTMLSKHVARLQSAAAMLKQHGNKAFTERAVQVDLGPQSYPLQGATKQNVSQPFAYRQPHKRIPWKRIRQLNVARIMDDSSSAEVMDVFEELAYGDLEGESVFHMSEANLIKLFQLAQLQLQYMQYKLEQARDERQYLEEGTLALRSRLAAMPALHLGEEQAALVGLERGMRQLGDTQVDAMFEQVRGEERTAAQTALSDAIQNARRRVDAKHGLAAGGTAANAGSSDVFVTEAHDQVHRADHIRAPEVTATQPN